MLLCLSLLLAGPALAQDASDFVGLPLVQVSLEPLAGALEDENLAPLLRVSQGAPYNPADVRSDLRMLHAVGAYEAVEAHVEPWFDVDDDGEAIPAVRLVYRVWPAPTLARIRVTGNRALKTPELLQAAGLREGARFFPEEDLGRTERALGLYYRDQGFTGTAIDLSIQSEDGGALALSVQVTEGSPDILGALSLVSSDAQISERRRLRRGEGTLSVSRRELLRIARRGGLQEGHRYTVAAVDTFRREVEQRLHRDGWVRARTYGELLPAAGGVDGDRLSIVISAGPLVTVEGRGRHLPDRDTLEALLKINQERQFSQAWAAEASSRVQEALRERGWLEAEVQVAAEAHGGSSLVITVSAKAGRRFRLARGGLSFSGNQALEDHTLSDAATQASPEVIGKRRATPSAVSDVLGALTDLYRSRGYLGAALQLADFSERGRRIAVEIAVEEGRQTTLSELRVTGNVPELQERVDAARASLEGGPLNPAAVRRLVRELSDAHRSLGYLGVDADSHTDLREADATASVEIRVSPGEQQRLRNVVVRGLRRTQRRLVEREVPLAVGDPITPAALAEIRSSLYDFEIFSTVSTELTGDDTRARDLLITVQERPAIALEAGAGVSTDEGVRAFTNATRRDLFGLGHSLQGLGQIGLGYTGDTWLPDTTSLEWRAALRYEAPRLPGPHQRLIADALLNEQRLEPTFRLRDSGAGVGVATELGDGGSLVVDYRVHWRRLQDVDPGALVVGDPWLETLGVSDPTTDPLVLPSAQRRQAGPSLLLLSDSRDDRFNPTRGSLFSLQLDTWDPLLSDTAGGKALGTAGRVQPLGPLSLHLSGQIGAGWSRGQGVTLPVEERFRLGGARTLRAYLQDSVGPKNSVSNQDLPWPSALNDLADYLSRDDPDRWVPTGGDAVVQASIELWMPLRMVGLDSAASLVAFSDVGNVFFVTPGVFADAQPCSYLDAQVRSGAASCPLFAAIPGDKTREPALRYGVGVGVRYPTPVGPLQLDVGFNPLYNTASWASDRGEVSSRFHLSLGSL